jgi:hypothetical protein
MFKRLAHGRAATLTRRHFVAVVIATAVGLATAQPAWAGWSEQTAPSPATSAQLNGVSCIASDYCEAVGSQTDNTGTFQLAETWNGSSWTENDPANPPGATNTALDGVSCIPGFCMAVGQSTVGTSSTLVSERWNGGSWTPEAVPGPAGASSSQFGGVSCASSACVAVGSYTTVAGTFPLAEAWNGSTWSIESAAIPPGATNSQLNGVSCANPTSCVAVGAIQTSTGSVSLAEAVAGAAWSIQSTPNPSGSTINDLNGVSCPSPTACVAVGSGIAEVWNGTAWNLTNPVKPPGDTSGPPSFSSVACVTANSCTAVGVYFDDSVLTATAELWNGKTWKAQDMTVGASTSSGLSAVACPILHACTAVGSFQDTVTNDSRVLVQRYSLTWTDQNVPPIGGTITSSLSSVTCGKFCTVAGTFTDTNGNVQGIVQYDDGVGWVPRQVANLSYSAFNGIWCTSNEGNCVVVGQASGPSPLAEAFNGSAFSLQPTPLPPGATDGSFSGVSCTSPTNCLAVGFYDVGEAEHALAESWNGTSWLDLITPEPAGSTYSLFNGVSCTASSCLVVGNYGDSSDNQQPLVEAYTAGSWTSQTAPLPAGGADPSLNAVSCPNATACVAVGQYFNGANYVPLAEKWNGTTWTSETPPAPAGSSESSLLGVTCTGAAACEAVGNWYDSSSNSYALAEGLSGKTWGTQATPSTGSTNSELSGVSCNSGGLSCTGAGDVSGPNPQSVLIEVYS